MTTREDLSIYISLHLDDLGFSEERLRERIYTINKCSKAKEISTQRITGRNDIEKIFVGSKREGIGFDYLNDTDVLQIDHSVVCQRGNCKQLKGRRTVFIAEHENVPPGHCLLRLSNEHCQTESYERIKYALVERQSRMYLSSKLFMTKNDDVFKTGTGYISQNTRYRSPRGPSIPKYVEEGLLEKLMYSMANVSSTDIDFVRAFLYREESMLKEWHKRPRFYNWPTAEVINYVVQQPVYIVPVGQKGSQNEDLQWRICFNLAEIHLVQSFNITQTRVLVLLKLIAKHILQPVSKCITSFVMKNVTFWMAEGTPQENYCEEHLIDRLEDALVYLQRCVEKGELPCYMIPQRNLFTENFQSGEQLLLQETLHQLLHGGYNKVEKYFTTHGSYVNFHEEMDDIINLLATANVLDKLLTCRVAMFSTEELTEYFVTMFLYESNLEFFFYHLIFHFVPFLYIYGKQGVFDPLSIGICEQISREQKAEETVVLQSYAPSEIELNEHRIGLKYTQEKDEFVPTESLLLLTVLIDLISIFQFPKPISFLIGRGFLLYLYLLLYAVFVLNELQKTDRRKTFVKQNGESIKLNTYETESLMDLVRTALFLTIIVILRLKKTSHDFLFDNTLMYFCVSRHVVVIVSLVKKVRSFLNSGQIKLCKFTLFY